MIPTITWLHLSDLHTNTPQTGVDAHRIITTLVKDLKELQEKHNLRPDFLFFTGDLAWGQVPGSNIADQFDGGKRVLDAVRAAFTPAIPEENVFIVPGNHDVDRDQAIKQLWPWLDGASKDEINEFMQKGGKEWDACFVRQRAYLEFLQRHKFNHLLADPERLIYTVKRQVAEHTIGIAGFNTSWSCGRKEEKSRLRAAGHYQVEYLDAQLATVDFKIALLHHPTGWFHDLENNDFWRLGIQNNFHVALHGHEHTTWVDYINGRLTISAGACYDRSDKPNGYSIVRLFPDQQRGEAWLRTYDSRGGGWVGDSIHGKTNALGVWALDDLRWLKPTTPSSSDAGSTDSALVVPANMTPEALQSKATEIRKLTEKLFGQSADVTSQVVATSSTTTRTHAPGQSITLQQINIIIQTPPSQESSPVQAEAGIAIKPTLDEIQKQLDALLLDDAEAKLNELLTRHLSPRDRFRVKVKLGHLWALRFDNQKAAQCYREGIAEIPSIDNHARYFLALAEEAEGQLDNAHKIISKLIEDVPDFEAAAAVSLWIRTASKEQKTKELVASLSDKAKPSEVMYTLARRAADEGDLTAAIELGRQALAGKPNWLDAQTSLANYIMERRFGRTVVAGSSMPPIKDWSEFREVQRLFTTAIAVVERGQAPMHTAMLRKNYALALSATGQFEEAAEVYKKANEEAGDDESIFRYALTLEKLSKSESAVLELRAWLVKHDSDRVRLLLAQILGRQSATGATREANLKEAIEMLQAGLLKLKLGDDTFEDYAAILSQFLSDAGRYDESRELLSGEIGSKLPIPFRLALLANTENEAGRKEEALTAAQSAADAYTGTLELQLAVPLANMLEILGDPARASAIWQKLADFRALGPFERNAIDCSAKAKNFEDVVRFCQRLRQAGVIDHQVLHGELWALERISPERLIKSLQEMIKLPLPEAIMREFTTQLSYIAATTGHDDLIERDSSKLLRVGELPTARAGRMVVEVLRRGPDPLSAVSFAYELFRRNPDSADAHLAVIFSSGMPDQAPVAIPIIETVRAGAAVRYKENDTGEEYWTIIEDSLNPRVSNLERSPEDHLAKQMIGKRVNETFSLGSHVVGRAATILEILDKHVYRYRDCIENFESRFPGRNYVWKMPVGDDPIGALLKQVEAREKQIDDIKRIYRENGVPLHILSNALGRSIFEAGYFVLQEPGLFLICSSGTTPERDASIHAVAAAKSLVADVSSLLTAFILHATEILRFEDLLKAMGRPIVVSEHTVADIRRALGGLVPREYISATVQHGKLAPQLVTEEAAKSYHERLRNFLMLVQSLCQIIPAEQPKAEDATWYAALEEAIGLTGAETVRLARQGHTIWTDELFVHQLARPQLGSTRVSTIVVIEFLRGTKKLPRSSAISAFIMMYLSGYRFIGISADMLTEAMKRSDGRPFESPLADLLKQYSEANITGESAVSSAAEFLTPLWLAANTKKTLATAKTITSYMLSELEKRPDGFFLMYKLTPRIIRARGMPQKSAKELRRLLRKHLRGE